MAIEDKTYTNDKLYKNSRSSQVYRLLVDNDADHEWLLNLWERHKLLYSDGSKITLDNFACRRAVVIENLTYQEHLFIRKDRIFFPQTKRIFKLHHLEGDLLPESKLIRIFLCLDSDKQWWAITLYTASYSVVKPIRNRPIEGDIGIIYRMPDTDQHTYKEQTSVDKTIAVEAFDLMYGIYRID